MANAVVSGRGLTPPVASKAGFRRPMPATAGERVSLLPAYSVILLHRVDPARHIYRWYSVNVQPTLLDPWAVICTWGSLKCQYRRQRAIPCESKDDAGRLAAKIVARKEAKGYKRIDSPETPPTA